VKKQDSASAQVIDMPYFAPEDAMEVTLPVPIMYPMIKIPGPIEEAKRISFDIKVADLNSSFILFSVQNVKVYRVNVR
jgi:hypothetical protein